MNIPIPSSPYCRICFKETENTLNPMNEQIRDDFYALTDILLIKSDIYSNQVCTLCITKVSDTRKYREELIANELRLMNEIQLIPEVKIDSLNSSQVRTRENSSGPSRSLLKQQQPPASSMSFSGPPAIKKPPSSAVLTEEEVDKMVKELVTVVDAYRDDKLTLEGAIEKAHKVSINKDVLIEIYNKFLDRKDKDRENLMLLVVEVLKQKMVLRDDTKLYEYIAQLFTSEELLKLKDAIAVPPVKLPEDVANTLLKHKKGCFTDTLKQTNPYPSKRPSQQGMKQQVGGSQSSSDRQIIKLNLSLQDNVKLNKAENAWKPSHLVYLILDEKERQKMNVLNKFRSMLNKLTAENFDVLVEQCRTFKIDTTERLDGVISLLFEKAISEPKFAPTYANLFKGISNIQAVPKFKVRLITQCQKEFERNKEDSQVFRDIEEKLRVNENEPDNEKREEQKVALEEEHYKLRQRANGTVKFIGELYKVDMLTSKIMKACIEMLLSEPTEEKVERVCKLLTKIGSKMESADGRPSLNKYFHILSDMTSPTHPIIKASRIKFEIQNLEDLRNNNWKARRQDLMPKTMDQMQWEAEQEQQMINFQTRPRTKEDRQRGCTNFYNKDVLLEIYNKFLDQKDKDRDIFMLMVVEMLKQKMVLRDDNKLALHKIMELAPDFQCDVPRVYEYIAQFLSELLIANVLTFQEVIQICQADACDKENILRYIFTAVEKRHGAGKLQHIVADSNCDLGQFTNDGNFARWLETNKFTSMVRREAEKSGKKVQKGKYF